MWFNDQNLQQAGKGKQPLPIIQHFDWIRNFETLEMDGADASVRRIIHLPFFICSFSALIIDQLLGAHLRRTDILHLHHSQAWVWVSILGWIGRQPHLASRIKISHTKARDWAIIAWTGQNYLKKWARQQWLGWHKFLHSWSPMKPKINPHKYWLPGLITYKSESLKKD